MELQNPERRHLARFNFAALFALSVVICIWALLSPIWLPVVTWVFSVLASAGLFLSEIFLIGIGFLTFGLALAVLGLLVGGKVSNSGSGSL